MSGRLPVIGSDIPAMRPLLLGAGGLLVEPGDEQGLAAALADYLSLTEAELQGKGEQACAYLLAPHIVEAMLGRKHGAEAMRAWRQRSEVVAAAAADYDRRATAGEAAPVYKFDHNVLHGEDVSSSGSELRLKGIAHAIDLQLDSPYGDML